MSQVRGVSPTRPCPFAVGAGGRAVEGGLEQAAGEFGVLSEPEAVAPDVDDVAVMHKPVDQGGGHEFVAEDLAPFFKVLVAREDRGGMLVAPAHQLEEEHRAIARDRHVADLVDQDSQPTKRLRSWGGRHYLRFGWTSGTWGTL